MRKSLSRLAIVLGLIATSPMMAQDAAEEAAPAAPETAPAAPETAPADAAPQVEKAPEPSRVESILAQMPGLYRS